MSNNYVKITKKLFINYWVILSRGTQTNSQTDTSENITFWRDN